MIWHFLKRDALDLFRSLTQKWFFAFSFSGIALFFIVHSPTSGETFPFAILAVVILYVGIAGHSAASRAGGQATLFSLHGMQDYLRALPVSRRKMFFTLTIRNLILCFPFYGLVLVLALVAGPAAPRLDAPLHPIPFAVSALFAFLCLMLPRTMRNQVNYARETSLRDWPRLFADRLWRLVKGCAAFVFWGLYFIVPGTSPKLSSLLITVAIGILVSAYLYRKREKQWLFD